MSKSTVLSHDEDRETRIARLSLVAGSDIDDVVSKEGKPLKVKSDRKVHLDLPAVHVHYLEQVAEWTGAKTFSEVIRTALKLYFVILRVSGGTGEIVVRNEKGETKLII